MSGASPSESMHDFLPHALHMHARAYVLGTLAWVTGTQRPPAVCLLACYTGLGPATPTANVTDSSGLAHGTHAGALGSSSTLGIGTQPLLTPRRSLRTPHRDSRCERYVRSRCRGCNGVEGCGTVRLRVSLLRHTRRMSRNFAAYTSTTSADVEVWGHRPGESPP